MVPLLAEEKIRSQRTENDEQNPNDAKSMAEAEKEAQDLENGSRNHTLNPILKTALNSVYLDVCLGGQNFILTSKAKLNARVLLDFNPILYNKV